jgi:hypothetical protein
MEGRLRSFVSKQVKKSDLGEKMPFPKNTFMIILLERDIHWGTFLSYELVFTPLLTKNTLLRKFNIRTARDEVDRGGARLYYSYGIVLI